MNLSNYTSLKSLEAFQGGFEGINSRRQSLMSENFLITSVPCDSQE